jgi:hypothetical protein
MKEVEKDLYVTVLPCGVEDTIQPYRSRLAIATTGVSASKSTKLCCALPACDEQQNSTKLHAKNVPGGLL